MIMAVIYDTLGLLFGVAYLIGLYRHAPNDTMLIMAFLCGMRASIERLEHKK
jgi:hypothetical protein